MKKVQLVLDSGGARGIAHIAIIEGLVKDGIEIEAIYGCSMGAVIGGIFAAGHLEEYKEWLLSLSKNDVFELMDFTLTKEGFIKGDKIFDKHREMTGELLIEEFDIPFTAVALDIKSGKEIYFTKGDLYQALRGSVAIPGFIIPHRTESYVLIDGGVTNPLPLNLAVRKEESVVLAIDLSGPKDPLFILKEVNNEEKNPIPHWFERIIPSYLQQTNKEKKDDKIEEEQTLSLLQLMETTFILSQNKLNELIIDKYEPELLIRLPRKMAQTLDFFRAKEIYGLGVKAYKKHRKQILEKIESN